MKHNARVRTESMIQKLSKQPVSEGFALMDKRYFLGAMRLLMVKAENAPPFMLGQCLEAIATILAQLQETEDAAENFGFAAEKYDLIMQPVLGNIMRGKALQQTQGDEAALSFMNEIIAAADPNRAILSMTDKKPKEQLARAYHFRAEIKLAMGQTDEGTVDDAQTAAAVGWDRGFAAHITLGRIHALRNEPDAALASFSQALTLNNNSVEALESMLELLEDKPEQYLATLDRLLTLHPRTDTIRAKAFKLSELGRDAEALAMLDQFIESPPQEEALGAGNYVSPDEARASILKTKAAILADQDKFSEAKEAAERALGLVPDDSEAVSMLRDIAEASAEAPAVSTAAAAA